MGTFKTKGIIIAESNMKDFDKMVTILTPNGRIGCSARGSRRPKSQLMAATQIFCYGEYLIFETPSTYTINSCEPIEAFYNIRTDLDKLQSAANITKLIRETTDENQNTEKILQLYLNTLYMISEKAENELDLEFYEAIFKLRLMCLLGYTPRIDKCTSCEKKDELVFFSLRDNGFKCKECKKRDQSCVEMNNIVCNAIRYIVVSPAKKIFDFKIKEDDIKSLSMIVKLYTKNQLDV